jgi:hypothetical protein
MSQANALKAQARQESISADANTDPSTQAAAFKQAEQDQLSSAALYAKAAGDATTGGEVDSATEEEASRDWGAATLIANSGQGGPGGAQQSEYDRLMANAQSGYNAAAMDPANPKSANDTTMFTDMGTLRSEVDAGKFNSAAYKNAYADAMSNNPAAPSSPASSTGAAGSTPASASFPSGNESSFQADMKAANNSANRAESELQQAQGGKMEPFSLRQKAMADFQAAAQSAAKAKTEATNDDEKTFAASMEGASDQQAAASIWQNGQAGPGHEESGLYRQLMNSASESYTSIANDKLASPSDQSNASRLASDINTMQIATDAGNSGKSQDYASAASDFGNINILETSASNTPSTGTTPGTTPSTGTTLISENTPSTGTDTGTGTGTSFSSGTTPSMGTGTGTSFSSGTTPSTDTGTGTGTSFSSGTIPSTDTGTGTGTSFSSGTTPRTVN